MNADSSNRPVPLADADPAPTTRSSLLLRTSTLRAATQRRMLLAWLATAAIVAACGGVGWLSHVMQLKEANVVMIFLAGVVLVAALFGHWYAMTATIVSVLVFDFFFVHPSFSFAPDDAQYFITFFVMLAIGLLISELTARLQSQLLASRDQERKTAELFQLSQQQERRTELLYRMTGHFSKLAGTELLVRTAGEHLIHMFNAEVVLFLREPDGSSQLRFGFDTSVARDPANLQISQWVANNDKAAGMGAEDFPAATARFVALTGAQRTIGALGIRPKNAERFHDAEERRMLESCANLIALSIERDQSILEAEQSQLQVQMEQLRNSLLSSVSHDLRTPLATIAVTASSLLEASSEQDSAVKREALQTVVGESIRLSRQVDKLLDMARLSSGTIELHCEWHILEELVGLALTRLQAELQDHSVDVEIPDEFPLVWVSEDLIELILVNLLENAIRYTPKGSRIEIQAMHTSDQVQIRIADNGPGLPRGTEAKIFEKFFRGGMVVPDGRRGVGLGLAICKAIVQAHGGQISAANRATGGAEFVISMPCPQQSAQVTLDETITQAGV